MGLGYQRAQTLTDLLGFHETVKSLEEVGLWQVNPGVPGFAAATIAAVATALLTRPPNQEVVELFDQVNGPGRTGSVAEGHTGPPDGIRQH